MAQHDYTIDNQTAANFRTDLNNALSAIVSNNSGASAPATTFANMIWVDSTNDTLYIRNESDTAWIAVGYLDQTNNLFKLFNNTVVVSSGGATVANVGVQLQTTWVTGTSTTDSLVSPAKIKAAVEALAPQGVGSGQTWQDMSASRATDTSYQNTTGKPIMVSLEIQASSDKPVQISTNGSTWVQIGSSGGDGNPPMSFVVPNGHYYRTTGGGTINIWAELR